MKCSVGLVCYRELFLLDVDSSSKLVILHPCVFFDAMDGAETTPLDQDFVSNETQISKEFGHNYNMQITHVCDYDIQICYPEVEMSTRGQRPSVTFQPRDNI